MKGGLQYAEFEYLFTTANTWQCLSAYEKDKVKWNGTHIQLNVLYKLIVFL